MERTNTMRFGDYIRDLRGDLKWTQPEAAKVIGIEQSYLSKLESGKSYPSEDVFSSLMTAYKIDLGDLEGKLFSADLDRLREISHVRSIIINKEKDDRKRVRKWLGAGIVALTIGGACLGASLIAEDTEVSQYQYRSEGVTRNTESINTVEGEPGDTILKSQQQDVTNGIDEKIQTIKDFRGPVFHEQVPDGTRMWHLIGSKKDVIPSPLRWFLIPALAFIFGGFGCFFASYRSS